MAYPNIKARPSPRPRYMTCIAVVLHRETERGLLVSLDGDRRKAVPLPKFDNESGAQIASILLRSKNPEFVTVKLPSLLATKRGLIVPHELAVMDCSVWPPVTKVHQPLAEGISWTEADISAWRDTRSAAHSIRNTLYGKSRKRIMSDWTNARISA